MTLPGHNSDLETFVCFYSSELLGMVMEGRQKTAHWDTKQR